MDHEIFIRALDKNDQWHSANALDLTDESFKQFILNKLVEVGILHGMKCEEDKPLKSTKAKGD